MKKYKKLNKNLRKKLNKTQKTLLHIVCLLACSVQKINKKKENKLIITTETKVKSRFPYDTVQQTARVRSVLAAAFPRTERWGFQHASVNVIPIHISPRPLGLLSDSSGPAQNITKQSACSV